MLQYLTTAGAHVRDTRLLLLLCIVVSNAVRIMHGRLTYSSFGQNVAKVGGLPSLESLLSFIG